MFIPKLLGHCKEIICNIEKKISKNCMRTMSHCIYYNQITLGQPQIYYVDYKFCPFILVCRSPTQMKAHFLGK